MKTLKKKLKTQKTPKAPSFLQSFEKDDLGDALGQFKNSGRWVKAKTKPTSIALSEDTILALREKAARKGIGYQTLLKMIVQEHLHEY